MNTNILIVVLLLINILILDTIRKLSKRVDILEKADYVNCMMFMTLLRMLRISPTVFAEEYVKGKEKENMITYKKLLSSVAKAKNNLIKINKKGEING